MGEHRHVITVLAEDRPGVLSHIAGLFSSRGYNIDSITAGGCEQPGMSRLTIVLRGDDPVVEQIIKQLRKIIDVIKVQDITHRDSIFRDLALVKVNCPPAKRSELCAVAEVFRANIVHVGEREMIIEVTGDGKKLDAFLGVVSPYGIKELIRTGEVAIPRGDVPSNRFA